MLIWQLLVILVVHGRLYATYLIGDCPIYPISGDKLNVNGFSLAPPHSVNLTGDTLQSITMVFDGTIVVNTVTGGYFIKPYYTLSVQPPSLSNGTIWLTSHTASDPILQQASSDFNCFGAPSNFAATWVFIATWDEIASASDASKTASYQFVLATDGSTTWIRLSYGVVDFPAGGEEEIWIGIDIDGDTVPDPGSVIDEYSGSSNAELVALDTNVECPGCYYFDLTSSTVINGVLSPCGDCPCVNGRCDTCQFGACDCNDGWTGDLCDQDIDECVNGTDNCDPRYQQCVNTDGSYICELLPCELCAISNPTQLHCKKYGFCFNVSTVLASASCASGGKEKYCKCLANKKETKTKWKCGKVKDAAVCADAIVVETCGLLNCVESNHKKFCGKGVDLCVGTDPNFNVASIFGKKDHKSVTTTCPGT